MVENLPSKGSRGLGRVGRTGRTGRLSRRASSRDSSLSRITQRDADALLLAQTAKSSRDADADLLPAVPGVIAAIAQQPRHVHHPVRRAFAYIYDRRSTSPREFQEKRGPTRAGAAAPPPPHRSRRGCTPRSATTCDQAAAGRRPPLPMCDCPPLLGSRPSRLGLWVKAGAHVKQRTNISLLWQG